MQYSMSADLFTSYISTPKLYMKLVELGQEICVSEMFGEYIWTSSEYGSTGMGSVNYYTEN